ncbi:class E sortase [Actinomyces sp. B33]|uniref:class E sortase n=1 Tax=Actinomyces sp. B33 TaxID=2942131 RepID=UPI002341A71E|nr:class E sortase [Actinomyces sp. B33]MDC4233966.1 class E sortase [Actinomyces sp. B33]
MGKHISPQSDPRRSRSLLSAFLGVVGELLITAAVVVGLFAVWQLYWTTYQVQGQVAQTIESYAAEHQPATSKTGEIRTDAPPEFAQDPGDGEVYGLLHIPSWDWMRTPLAEGTTSQVLDQGWAGHYEDTAQPGQIGNFSVAGHRRTYGNNFRWIDRLGQGDAVVVELDDVYMVYAVENWEIVSADDPDNIRVIAPVINDLTFSQQPTERWMTMTTCHPEYGNSERYIVHLKFRSWTPKSSGVPAELVDEPSDGAQN